MPLDASAATSSGAVGTGSCSACRRASASAPASPSAGLDGQPGAQHEHAQAPDHGFGHVAMQFERDAVVVAQQVQDREHPALGAVVA
jgi:hypothetical protein